MCILQKPFLTERSGADIIRNRQKEDTANKRCALHYFMRSNHPWCGTGGWLLPFIDDLENQIDNADDYQTELKQL